MQPLQTRFQTYWKTQLRIESSQPVLVAVSGGVDSMVLATLLYQLGYSFAIAHCNFGLRRADSEADAAFVESWAEAHGITFFRNDFDTKAEAAQGGWGIQETARRLRYNWFESLRTEKGFAAIATAHHADDSAETVLMNLFRGTGLRGLHGILPKQGKLIRPLLFAPKKELLEYAEAHAIAFRKDASNDSSDYTRNALRHQILPVIEAQYPEALKAIAETAVRVAAAEPLYEKAISRLRKKLVEPRGADYYLPIRLWQKTDGIDALLYELLTPFGFTGATVPQIKNLMTAQSGQYLNSPTHRLLRHRDFLVLTTRNEAVPTADLYLIEAGTSAIDFPEGTLHLSGAPVGDYQTVPSEEALLNAGSLQWPLVLRRWKPGDYFYPLGMGNKKKKVARFLIDQKLSIAEKEKIWVLLSGDRIAWVVGLRIDERFKLKPSTPESLHIVFKVREPSGKQ